jgi:hypothetical protein
MYPVRDEEAAHESAIRGTRSGEVEYSEEPKSLAKDVP